MLKTQRSAGQTNADLFEPIGTPLSVPLQELLAFLAPFSNSNAPLRQTKVADAQKRSVAAHDKCIGVALSKLAPDGHQHVGSTLIALQPEAESGTFVSRACARIPPANVNAGNPTWYRSMLSE